MNKTALWVTKQIHFLLPWVLALAAMPALSQQQVAQLQDTEIRSFVDGLMESAVASGDTVGGIATVVVNGRLVTAQGYGLSDLANAQPVDPQTTTFRIGSITKVLTWIGLLQQHEAGRLQLDNDVNGYLRAFQLSDDYNTAITLRHLMTHTAGFEDSLKHLFVGGPRQMGRLEDVLMDQMPRRVQLPGAGVAYSNYGVALAGYLTAQAAEQDWAAYTRQYVLEPLGMRSSSVEQPLSDAMNQRRSKGFVRTADGFEEQNFSFIPLAPAGGASATALDMGRLMRELLNPRGSAVLSARSKKQLSTAAFKPSDDVNGVTLGMYEMTMGGPAAFGHDGSTVVFTSRMVLWPEHNVGFFVSFNTDSAAPLVNQVTRAFATKMGLRNTAAKYQPVDSPRVYPGVYRTTRRNHSDYTQILSLADVVEVSYEAAPDLLRVSTPAGSSQYRQIAPHTFAELEGSGRVVFRDIEPGQAGLSEAGELYRSDVPVVAYERVTGIDTPANNLLLLAVWAVLALSVLLYWPVASLSRMRQVSVNSFVLSAVVVASVLSMLWFAVMVANTVPSVVSFTHGGIRDIEPLLWIPALFVALVLVQFVFLYRVWVLGTWWFSRRVHYTLMLVGNCLLVWWLWHWKLFPDAVLGFV